MGRPTRMPKTLTMVRSNGAPMVELEFLLRNYGGCCLLRGQRQRRQRHFEIPTAKKKWHSYETSG